MHVAVTLRSQGFTPFQDEGMIWYIYKRGEADETTNKRTTFSVISSTRAEQRAVKRDGWLEKRKERGMSVLMWNGGKNWSNGLKKLLEKWKGRDEKFLVDIRNSFWSAYCSFRLWECVGLHAFPSHYKCPLVFVTTFKRQDTHFVQNILARSINKLILIDWSWQVFSLQQHIHNVFTCIFQ